MSGFNLLQGKKESEIVDKLRIRLYTNPYEVLMNVLKRVMLSTAHSFDLKPETQFKNTFNEFNQFFEDLPDEIFRLSNPLTKTYKGVVRITRPKITLHEINKHKYTTNIYGRDELRYNHDLEIIYAYKRFNMVVSSALPINDLNEINESCNKFWWYDGFVKS